MDHRDRIALRFLNRSGTHPHRRPNCSSQVAQNLRDVLAGVRLHSAGLSEDPGAQCRLSLEIAPERFRGKQYSVECGDSELSARARSSLPA